MKNTLLLLIVALIALSCQDKKNDPNQDNAYSLSRFIDIETVDMLPQSTKLALSNTFDTPIAHTRNIYIETKDGNRKLVSTAQFDTPGKDTVEVSELTRSTDYNAYIEYIVEGCSWFSEPFAFNTPQTAPDNKRIYDNLQGLTITPEVKLIEGNEFSIFSFGGFNQETKVEFVDLAKKIYPATYKVVSENEIICTVPTTMLNDSFEKFQASNDFFIHINGTPIAPYDKTYYREESGRFKIYNTAPRISIMMFVRDQTKEGFVGSFYDFPTTEVKNFLNLTIVPDSYNFCIEQNGIKRVYENAGTFNKALPEEQSIIHKLNSFTYEKSLIPAKGEVTVWLEFQFGETTISTNKFVYTHE